MAIAVAMRMNSEGIKVQISGRLNGAEMASQNHIKRKNFQHLDRQIMPCKKPILMGELE